MRKKKRNWISIARRIVQASFALFILVAAIRHHTSAVSTPSTHAYCPFGVLASLWPLVTTGKFAPKIHTSAWC